MSGGPERGGEGRGKGYGDGEDGGVDRDGVGVGGVDGWMDGWIGMDRYIFPNPITKIIRPPFLKTDPKLVWVIT